MSSLYKSYGSKGISLTAKGKEDFQIQLDQVYAEEPQRNSGYLLRIGLRPKAQYKDIAQHQDIRTGGTALKLPLSYKTINLYRTIDIRRTLLPLDGRNGTYKVSKVRKDKASGPVLDVEEVTVLLSSNAKG